MFLFLEQNSENNLYKSVFVEAIYHKETSVLKFY